MVDLGEKRPRIYNTKDLEKDLSSRPVPSLSTEQLNLFKYEDLATRPVYQFNFERLPRFFENNQGTEVLAFDLGGDKAAMAMFRIKRKDFVIDESWQGKFFGDQGKGQLKFLEGYVEDERIFNLPVGISTAGVVKGTILAESPCEHFYKDLVNNYRGDFAELFPCVLVLNDAVAGLITGIMKTNELFPKATIVIYEINGGGLGGAVLMGDTIWSAEPGHVRALSEINRLGVDRACRMNPQKGVCIENISASGAFIEHQWKILFGKKLDGRKIEEEYYYGNRKVADLYDASAIGLAHALVGLGNVWSLWNNPEDVAVVLHGGGFKAPGVADRVMQIVNNHFNTKFNYVATHSFSDNACLEGAGIAKLLTDNGILEQIEK